MKAIKLEREERNGPHIIERERETDEVEVAVTSKKLIAVCNTKTLHLSNARGILISNLKNTN